jgi:hypothetical protein
MNVPGWMPDPMGDDRNAAALGTGGIIVFLLGIARGSRILRALGFGAFLAAGAVFARGLKAERDARMEEATEAARSALDDLDPIARAQVLEALARPEH